MRIMICGAAGESGRAVHCLMARRGHEAIGIGRGSDDIRLDITDPAQPGRLRGQARCMDAVVVAAGEAPCATIDVRAKDNQAALTRQVLDQINLVHTGPAHVAECGSLTLSNGIPLR